MTSTAKILQFPARASARVLVAVPRASLLCPDCSRYFGGEPEATLLHLAACEAGDTMSLTREQAIARIKAGLKARSGKSWSVAGGKGTAWGWLRVAAPPARRVDSNGTTEGGRWYTSTAECAELASLLGLERVHHQGESVPSGSDFYSEFVARAEGRTPTVFGSRNWD